MGMAKQQRETDPRQLTVQLNLGIPWAFREYLGAQAELQKTSLNKLCIGVLQERFGEGYEQAEAQLTKASR